MPTGAGVVSKAIGKGCMDVGREPGPMGTVGTGGGCWVGGGGRVGGVCCWAFTALETSSSQRSASDGVRLWPVEGGD